MTKSDTHTECPACGARLTAGAQACDLCGHEPGAPVEPEAEEPVAVAGAARPARSAAPASSGGVFCNQCGWHNPAGARFCSRCGSPLQQLAAAPAKAPAPAGRRAGGPRRSHPVPAVAPGASIRRSRTAIVAAACVLLAVAVYLLTAGGGNAGTAAAPVGTEAERPAAVSLEVMRQAVALEEQIETLTGPERVAKQRELADLFAHAGRYDRAAGVQEEVARLDDTPEAWTRAGNFHYDYMMSVDGEERAAAAVRAVAAYRRVLEQEPDNLDVRTDMAVAYQYDPENAAEAVTQTQAVLDRNAEHLQANFNMGVFMLQGNRLDEALPYFENVTRLAPAGTPTHERARELIRYIKGHANLGSMGG